MEKNLRTNSLSEIERVLKTRLIHDTHELAKRLELDEIVTPTTEKAAKITPTLFPESLLNRVQKGNAEDPILLQFMPSPHELEITPNFSCDPLCEQKLDVSERQTASSSPSCIMQKYYGRVLVITTNACACQCRFCFRRYFPKNRALFPLSKEQITGSNEDESNVSALLDNAFETVRKDDSISEIILSGGDPLTLSNKRLKTLLHYIGTITHVKRVRFHSRIPVLSPHRIDDDFPSSEDFPPVEVGVPRVLHLVLHVNSPNEIDEGVAVALSILRRKGFVLTSQTTLLKGVNDDVKELTALFEKLINLCVLPYYLHQLDRVQGSAHFETTIASGREIIEELSVRLPGYAVPRYVREIPGRLMKTNLFIDRDVD